MLYLPVLSDTWNIAKRIPGKEGTSREGVIGRRTVRVRTKLIVLEPFVTDLNSKLSRSHS
jgi:hypothetical protein